MHKSGLIKVEAADGGAPVLALLCRFQPVRARIPALPSTDVSRWNARELSTGHTLQQGLFRQQSLAQGMGRALRAALNKPLARAPLPALLPFHLPGAAHVWRFEVREGCLYTDDVHNWNSSAGNVLIWCVLRSFILYLLGSLFCFFFLGISSCEIQKGANTDPLKSKFLR